MKHLLHIALVTCISTCTLFARPGAAPANNVPPAKNPQIIFQGGNPVFSDDNITVSGVFPNPASATATLEYEITGEMKEAKFTLSNVLGSAVAEYKLSRESRKLQFTVIDFAPGIYFYTLSTDGKSLFTRKLIIRHSS